MIIFLYGPDIYRREVKVRELLKVNREKRKDADIGIFDLEEEKETWKEVKDFLSQPSMFSETKTAVIYESGVADNKEWRGLLKKEIDSKEHILIISDTNAPKKNFSFLLDPSVKSTEYAELDRRSLSVFLKKEAEMRSLSFSRDAWEDFVEHIETFQLKSAAGVQELKKFELFFGEKEITKEKLHLIIQTTQKEDAFFAAKKIIFEKDIKKRIAILERAFLNNVDPAHLFNTIAFLARGKEIEQLANLDVKIKSGKAEYEDVLLEFVLKK
jgi:DNA polymerase III delta subunit